MELKSKRRRGAAGCQREDEGKLDGLQSYQSGHCMCFPSPPILFSFLTPRSACTPSWRASAFLGRSSIVSISLSPPLQRKETTLSTLSLSLSPAAVPAASPEPRGRAPTLASFWRGVSLVAGWGRQRGHASWGACLRCGSGGAGHPPHAGFSGQERRLLILSTRQLGCAGSAGEALLLRLVPRVHG